MNLPTDDDLSVTHAQLTMLTAHQRRVKRPATRKGREEQAEELRKQRDEASNYRGANWSEVG